MGNILRNGEIYGTNDVETVSISQPKSTDDITIRTWDYCYIHKVGHIAILNLDCQFTLLGESTNLMDLFAIPDGFKSKYIFRQVIIGHLGFPTLISINPDNDYFQIRPVSGSATGYYRIIFPYIVE